MYIHTYMFIDICISCVYMYIYFGGILLLAQHGLAVEAEPYGRFCGATRAGLVEGKNWVRGTPMDWTPGYIIYIICTDETL